MKAFKTGWTINHRENQLNRTIISCFLANPSQFIIVLEFFFFSWKFPMKSKSLLITTSMIYSFPFQFLSSFLVQHELSTLDFKLLWISLLSLFPPESIFHVSCFWRERDWRREMCKRTTAEWGRQHQVMWILHLWSSWKAFWKASASSVATDATVLSNRQ